MIISLNWLKQYTDINLSVDELVKLIGERLVEVESVTDLGKKYEGIIITKVIEAGPVEGTDHLNLVKIDDGGVNKDVDRDDNGLVQVICGAPNVRPGIFVAWLPPKSTVPATYGTSDPLVLEARELRGHISNGMLASPKELDLSDNHEGIMEIPESIPGKLFAEVYQLNDYLLDIENKSLTHRPDCFGVIGFAREVAAIQGQEFVTPEWLAEVDPIFKTVDTIELKVTIDDPDISERYQAVVLGGVDKISEVFPLTPTLLARSGLRSISPIVDATNYLMLETGQPLHAFDYDKLLKVGDGKIDIHVRSARKGEKLGLLDGRMLELDSTDIVIANGDKAVALAGAMGGAETEIDSKTKNILIESASFNLYRLRATQMRHGMFSEAVTRFTKGQPAELTAPVLARAIDLISDWTGATQASSVVEAKGNSIEDSTIELTVNEVNGLLGTAINQTEIEDILRNVEFAAVESGRNILTVSPPYWRRDIHIKEDIIEEIGRIGGFDSINPTLPLRDFSPVSISHFDRLRTIVRQTLTSAGANEVLTYSFVHGDIIKKSGGEIENSYRITNSISPELQYYRQSLTASLLGLVNSNIKQGFEEFALYELNKVHPKNLGLDEESVPFEKNNIALVFASKKNQNGAAFYRARYLVGHLLEKLNISVSYKALEENMVGYEAYETKRSALIVGMDNKIVGVVGEYKSYILKNFKLPQTTAGFELDANILMDLYAESDSEYKISSKYPGTDRDICFKVNQDIKYETIVDLASAYLLSLQGIESTISPIDIYSSDESTDKNITIRINLVSFEKTLTSEEANNIISGVIGAVVKETDAKIV